MNAERKQFDTEDERRADYKKHILEALEGLLKGEDPHACFVWSPDWHNPEVKAQILHLGCMDSISQMGRDLMNFANENSHPQIQVVDLRDIFRQAFGEPQEPKKRKKSPPMGKGGIA